MRRIREACRKYGIAAGIHCASGEWARRHAEADFDMVTVANDTALLKRAARTEAAVARGEHVGAGPTQGYS